MARYCVCWKDSKNKVHRGRPTTLELATAWVDDLNIRWQEIHHFVEQAKTKPITKE